MLCSKAGTPLLTCCNSLSTNLLSRFSLARGQPQWRRDESACYLQAMVNAGNGWGNWRLILGPEPLLKPGNPHESSSGNELCGEHRTASRQALFFAGDGAGTLLQDCQAHFWKIDGRVLGGMQFGAQVQVGYCSGCCLGCW